ncbi:MAG: aminotransferase class I/II-fold pyridoxal phosphate-dependent enzyme [Pseudomonadota bacterium]|nr:aminotransferase class I/II-fold pyridoxal phosphate-dependent enzyme [Pseudomonadota bacterium]
MPRPQHGLPRPPAERGAIDPFIVMDVMRQANARESAGDSVIHLEVGQPGTPAPTPVIEAARRALDTSLIGYTEALGLPRLRERIAAWYGERYGVRVSPDRVIVTTGSSAGFLLAFLAILDIGARVALPSPGYPCYRHILKSVGAEAHIIETGEQTRWSITPDLLAQAASAARLDALLLASPANPTGTMLLGDGVRGLVDACASAGLWFVSDEIYHGLDYVEPAQTALAYSDAPIVINSFSKYFSMTGWRIGWMVVPPGLVRSIERLAQNLYISPPTLSQHAAIAAFDAIEELEAIKAVYARNRALLLEALPRAGLDNLLPADGAFYIYADVRRFTNDSAEFAARMLKETGIAATPGVDFDAGRGQSYVRFCYSGTTEDIMEAASRLKTWLA